jgi:sporulation protein YlmC with PRC-barrel domain
MQDDPMALRARLTVPLLAASLIVTVPDEGRVLDAADRAAPAASAPPDLHPQPPLASTREAIDGADGTVRIADLPAHHMSDDLIGLPVRSPGGEDLGSLGEIVIEPDTGRIKYAVLAFSGTPGVGQTLHAVPWIGLRPHHGDEGTLQHLLLDVTAATLGDLTGFNGNDYPDVANDGLVPSDPWVHQVGERHDGRAMERDALSQPLDRENLWVHRVSQFEGVRVHRGSESLGAVERLVIDAERGRVCYAIVIYGGVLGMGGQRVAIPWRAMAIDRDRGVLVVEVDERTLDRLAFDRSGYPNFADQRWAQQTNDAFGSGAETAVFGYTIDMDREPPASAESESAIATSDAPMEQP